MQSSNTNIFLVQIQNLFIPQQFYLSMKRLAKWIFLERGTLQDL